jgi:undecaprenyl diphosphate synthase
MQNLHVAIIMDGNGRWALRRGLPRTAGHVEGAKAVNAIVEASARAGIRTLTLYAFSSDNWGRPSTEVHALMRLLRRYLTTETRRCLEQSIRINIIGRRDRLSPSLVRAIEQSERLTAQITHRARPVRSIS